MNWFDWNDLSLSKVKNKNVYQDLFNSDLMYKNYMKIDWEISRNSFTESIMKACYEWVYNESAYEPIKEVGILFDRNIWYRHPCGVQSNF